MTALVSVVPHEGTWIEIANSYIIHGRKMSFPTRERGLKSFTPGVPGTPCAVVPHEGTWIEIPDKYAVGEFVLSFPTRERGLKSITRQTIAPTRRRSPRGNVD